jgi:glucose-6-phosphate isomerase
MAYAIAYIADQYMSLCDSGSDMPGLSDWAEQLVAESTGKNHVGRLPIVLESPVNDALFSIAYSGDADLVISADLASQFIIWEWVTTLLCAALAINPYNQPNITQAKEATSSLLDVWAGKLPQFSPDAQDGAIGIFGEGKDLKSALSLFIQSIPHDGYVAVMAYLDRRDDIKIMQIRALLADKSHRPVSFGWGPRFLHSAGQFHKGGQPNGAFLQITGEVERDYAIPNQVFGFKTLIAAQALGDAQALASRKYPLLRLNLINRSVGIDELLTALKSL